MARKSHQAVNIISYISVLGVTVGTMALIVVLSVFNGFDELVKSLLNAFNPDIKITLAEGKTFFYGEEILSQIKTIPGVLDLSLVMEDKALVRYDKQQTFAEIKGVDDHYSRVTGIDSMLVEGQYHLGDSAMPYAVLGRGICIFLNVMLLSPRQMTLFVPRRESRLADDPARALNRKYLSASGVFSVEQDFDVRYILVPISFARELFGYAPKEISAIEIKLDPACHVARAQESIQNIMGAGFKVKNRYQQNELFYKTMRAEKWAIFLILIFILIVASFNVIGTLTMLILEKNKDIATLSHLGAHPSLIRRIFLLEGWMVTFTGALLGTILGLLICWLQQRFGLIRLQGSGSFIIDAYPVVVKGKDVALTMAAVAIIGFTASWYPTHVFAKKQMTY
jgi:lipoprotein-releasing system permease protein